MEESPLSVKDLIKQRSRWLVGIMRDFYVSEEHFSCTFALISGFAVWFGFPLTTMCLCFSVLLAPLDVFYPILDDFVIFIMASMPFYFFYGSQVNFRLTSAKRLAFSIVQLTGVPMILAMAVEGCGVFHAIYTIVTEGADKAKNFHFTKKAAVMRTASHKLR